MDFMADQMAYKKNESIEFITLDDDSLVAFDPTSGQTHIMNDVGKDILDLCDGSKSYEDIVSLLKKQYDVPEDEIKNDIREYLAELVNKGVLIKVEI